MTKHLLLLTFLSVLFVTGVRAQLKFGVAAGYEHINSTTSNEMASSGGLSGGLLFRYPLSPHWELQLAPSIGVWSTSFTYTYRYSYQSLGISRPVDFHLNVIHITTPLYACYTLPLDRSALFGGPGFFWSSTSMTGGEYAPIADAIGLSLLAGIRGEHWQVAAEYRPWLHDYKHTGEPFDGQLSGNISIKLGYLFGHTTPRL
ncbi:MAG TPA: hypothetical protein VGM30_06035 [Puia sp.]|jgi:hypothetical protein